MLGIHDLPLFIVSGLLLNIAPGPDSLLIMTRSASQGWRAGSAAALGIGTGTLVHVLAAALGLSALLSASAAAFALVKYAGAAYLAYIGFSMLRAGRQQAEVRPGELARLSRRRIYMQGLLTNVLNPKVALFFLAFVPQFIDADAPHKAWAFIVLGLVFDFNGMLWCHALALFTGLASRRVRLSGVWTAWLKRGIGALFVGLGLRLAWNR